MIAVAIHVIAEGLKFVGCRSVRWIFKMIRRRIMKLSLNEFSMFQAYQFGPFDQNKLQNKQDNVFMACMHKSRKLI